MGGSVSSACTTGGGTSRPPTQTDGLQMALRGEEGQRGRLGRRGRWRASVCRAVTTGGCTPCTRLRRQIILGRRFEVRKESLEGAQGERGGGWGLDKHPVHRDSLLLAPCPHHPLSLPLISLAVRAPYHCLLLPPPLPSLTHAAPWPSRFVILCNAGV